jgi:hypothetical protein
LVGERIRLRVNSQAINHNGQNFSVTASIGVATFPDHANEYDLLIACAIEALKQLSCVAGTESFLYSSLSVLSARANLPDSLIGFPDLVTLELIA